MGPRNGWSPATYLVDSCWGPHTRPCNEAASEHHVSVIVRSAGDPFIKAEELTDGTFNFGMSASSQRILGIVALVIAICFGFLHFGFSSSHNSDEAVKTSRT